MKIILSRKGFDSASGGKPNPIFPDNRMFALPIPDRQSPIRYADVSWEDHNVGDLVSQLTKGRVPATFQAHLDPDLRPASVARQPGWRPLFGQAGPAQGHLMNNNVQRGDVFVYFGLFRRVCLRVGQWTWDRKSLPRHVIWGWLQVGELFAVDCLDQKKYNWALYHPHMHHDANGNNTLYMASDSLSLAGEDLGVPGAGVFHSYVRQLQLSTDNSKSPCLWELPAWCFPREDAFPFTYHGDLKRWQHGDGKTLLDSVARGQEFILDCEQYPESIQWLKSLLKFAAE